MPDRFHYRRITDAVHGTYGISELEADIISTSVFQRLHGIRQLGLAHLVFPGADYSRFAHSLGACHIAGRMVRGINQNCENRLDDDEIQMYRLSGLLHDLGHYPFSHATEHVVADYYQQKAYLTSTRDGTDGAAIHTSNELIQSSDQHSNESSALEEDAPPPSYRHEPLGRAVIQYDEEIGHVLKRHGISANTVRAVLSREMEGGLTSLVSSDLDCDRLDYLMRTAHCAGLPYGKVDLEYITSQMCVDSQGHLCLTKKALRAADHLLISRYFDYTQLVFHKTVVALEILLCDVIKELLGRGLLDGSGSKIKQMIVDSTFSKFDDQYMISRFRESLEALGKDDPLYRKVTDVLTRRPPKLVASCEKIAPAEEGEISAHRNLKAQLEGKMREAAAKFGIDLGLWHLWSTSLGLAKIGSRISLGDATSGSFEEEIMQAVRVLTTAVDAEESRSKPLVEHNFAILNQLSQTRFYAIRLFVHVPDDDLFQRAEIEEYFATELPHFPFSP